MKTGTIIETLRAAIDRRGSSWLRRADVGVLLTFVDELEAVLQASRATIDQQAETIKKLHAQHRAERWSDRPVPDAWKAADILYGDTIHFYPGDKGATEAVMVRVFFHPRRSMPDAPCGPEYWRALREDVCRYLNERHARMERADRLLAAMRGDQPHKEGP